MTDALKMRWYVVGAPWLPSGLAPYIVADNEDPHVGIPIVDLMDADEWMETRDDDPPNPFEIAAHIVKLHNDWLDRVEDKQ